MGTMSRATLADVSEKAGVSKSTASLVVRGSTRISEATRERVLSAMNDLGYVYNRQAAMMRQSKSFTIGLVVTEIRNPYFAELTMVIEEAIHAGGYQLFVGYSRDDIDRQQELVEAMVQRQVDGLLILPASGSQHSQLESVLVQTGVPTVQVARFFTPTFDYVGADNVSAGARLAEHVMSLGVTSAVLVGGPIESSARNERIQGLEVGFESGPVRFDRTDAIPAKNTPEDGARGMAEVLQRGDLPDVIIPYSDAIAIGVYDELRRNGFKPGRDIAVASFDDIPLAAMQVPPLTSMATHPQRVAQAASTLLLERIDDPQAQPARLLIEPTLRVRASTVKWRRRT